jgi:predicted nucleic acid-binding protein
VKLFVEEPGSAAARRLWEGSTRAVCSRLLYPEARAALGAAPRTGRMGKAELLRARAQLEELWEAVDRVAVRMSLVRRAGDLADQHALCGYDAVHLASLRRWRATRPCS